MSVAIPEGTSPYIAEDMRRRELLAGQRRALQALADDLGMTIDELLEKDAEKKREQRQQENRIIYPWLCHETPAEKRRRIARQGDGRELSRNRHVRLEIIHRDKWTCYLCGAKLKYDEIHLDHLVPLSRGGENTKENLAVACAECNIAKGNRTPAEYRAMLGSSLRERSRLLCPHAER